MFSKKTSYYLYVNYLCNQRCIFCASPHTNQKNDLFEIPWEKLKTKLESEELNSVPVIISGGELTLYQPIFELLDYLKMHSSIIDIMTNGKRLSEKPFAKQILSYPISSFSIPIYGFETTHNRIVDKKSFKNLLKALDIITEAGIELNIKLLITKHNYQELPLLLKFLVDRYEKLPHYSLNTLIYGDKTQKSNSWIPIMEVQHIVSETLRIAFNMNLNLSLSYLPACAFTIDFLKDHLLEYFVLSQSKYTQQPGSCIRIITSHNPAFDTFQDKTYFPLVCSECDLQEICLKVHSFTKSLDSSELGLNPICLTNCQ